MKYGLISFLFFLDFSKDLASRMPEAMCLMSMANQTIPPFFPSIPLVQDMWASGHAFFITILPFAEIRANF